ncbi:hypothetical protein ACVQGR_001628 [Escherichia coli]
MDLTQVSVREILHYNPVSGDFYWKPRAKHLFADNRAALTWNKKYPGKKAGSPDNKGYAIKQKEHPMQQFAIAGAASVRHFNPILSVQHSRKNILTGADFKQPRMKSLLEKLWDILKQQGRP